MTRKALIAPIQQFIFNNVWILKCLRRLFDHSTFSKSFETLFKSNLLHAAITCTRKRGGICKGAWSSQSDKRSNSIKVSELAQLKLQLHDAIYRLRFFSNSLIHISWPSNSHNNVASTQKNRGDKSHRVIVALSYNYTMRFIGYDSIQTR